MPIEEVVLKRCNKCNLEMGLSYFARHSRSLDGLSYFCRSCLKEKSSAYYQKNKIIISEKQLIKVNLDKEKRESLNSIDIKCFKVCAKCKVNKKREFFSKKVRSPDGLNYYCSSCVKEMSDKYYKNNREKIKERNTRNRLVNREKINKQKKEHYKNNPQIASEYRMVNKKKISEKALERYKNRKAKGMEYHKINAVGLNKNRNDRYKNNINFKMKRNLSSRLGKALRYAKANKTINTLDLLGCSLDFFISYIESKFVGGMTWDNHSFYGWHIDHIRPCCSFDLTDIEQQKACFHYTNLQPLWSVDNLRKNGKYSEKVK